MTGNVQFSLAHYEHMVAVGAFSGKFEKRLELLRGEIVRMNPIGPPHSQVLIRLMDWSYQVVPLAKMAVCGQGPIRVPASDSEPEPDLVWTVQGDFSNRLPEPHEVLLLVEVADTSLDIDRSVKLGIYAEAGIADYWIVNLIDEQIEVYRKPVGREYQDRSVFRGDTPVKPLALPTAAITPAQLFP
jgi:Uma2 family endonuclease